jgi:Spy/CpxP family protein refolding chaperone
MQMNLNSGRYVERFLIAAGVALAVPLTAVAFGGPHGGPNSCGGAEMSGKAGPRGMGGERMPPYLRALSLSEAQRDKVFAIMHAQVPAMRDKAKVVQRAEADLRGLALAPDYSEARARALADASAKAMAEMVLARVATDRQVLEVLTPEQRKQVAEMKPEREASRGDGPRR